MLMFVYGTLKRGHCNYDRYFLSENSLFVTEHYILGYEMYSYCDDYPYIVKSKYREIVYGEILDVTNQAVADRISAMEIGAGYQTNAFIYDDQPVTFFEMVNFDKNDKKMLAGNWQ